MKGLSRFWGLWGFGGFGGFGGLGGLGWASGSYVCRVRSVPLEVQEGGAGNWISFRGSCQRTSSGISRGPLLYPM